MSENFNQHYNKDNTMLRNNVVGLIAELSKNLYYYQQESQDNNVKKYVPVMYSITGQERFLKDEFFYDAIENGKAIGDYESNPRCIIQLNGISINQQEQANKYIHTHFTREVNGILRTCYLMTNFVPIRLSFNCTILCNNSIEQFKLTEVIISKIYKSPNVFNLMVGPFAIQAIYDVPTDFNHDKPVDYGMQGQKEYKIEFSIDMASYLPCFENGLTLAEIDEMLKDVDNTKAGYIEFRPDKMGNMRMCIGGIIEKIIDNNVIAHDIETKIIK